MSVKKPNIGILTFPIGKAGISPLSNLIDILYPLSDDICLITGNAGYDFFKENRNIYVYGIRHERGASVFTRIIRYIYTQLRISHRLVKLAGNVDLWIFSYGGQELLLPMLTAKLLKKKVILLIVEYSAKIGDVREDQLGKPPKILNKINRTLSDQIIIDINVESENLIHQFGLTNYKHKISFGGAGPVDTKSFNIKKKLEDRKNLIGYFGRHTPEKGVMNFAKAIPLILKERGDLEFLIGGGGPLFDEMKHELKDNGSYDKVTFTGWVPREKLPDYYNEMKLIVVPSYTETIPTVIMETMACGTPIVAAPAVAIPDLIKDGENGFLMEDNSPGSIAKNVIRALDDPRLDEIVKSAHDLINREYTYEVTVENYRKLLMGKDK